VEATTTATAGRGERDRDVGLGFRGWEAGSGAERFGLRVNYKNLKGLFAKWSKTDVSTRKGHQCSDCSRASGGQWVLINPDVFTQPKLKAYLSWD